MEQFEPVIVAFCCHYCAYTAADVAGSMRISYPSNVHIIKVPCSGKVDGIHIMKAFQKGADGVYVAGCLEGDCHFKDGNIKASRRVAYLKLLLDEIGIGGERLSMLNMSAGMGDRFASTATEFTDRIRGLGPNPVKRAAPRKAVNEG
ncbi:MAG: hydrogenase iron-sulfur subunit [Desulfobacteraceae bacterium]|nr:MAG: hydrogenase iron-sulfur subunit [Desulfobacteraceae bacterium]